MTTTTAKDDPVFSLLETADRLRCSLRHVHGLIASGKLGAIKNGRRTLVRATAIAAYLETLPSANRKAA